MITWCLPTYIEEELLTWAEMSRELWDELAIIHRMAVFSEYINTDDYTPIHLRNQAE